MVDAVSGPRCTLGRGARLKRGGDFERLRRAGARLVVGCLIVNWQRLAGGRSRVGVVVGRNVGSAVRRNRARRLLREVFRLHQHELAQPAELVLVARPSIAGKARQEVELDFQRFLREAGLRRGA